MRRRAFVSWSFVLLLAPVVALGAQPAYVVNNRGGDISVVDIASGTTVDTWPTKRLPRDIAISADGLWLYVAASNGISITDVLWHGNPVEVEFQQGGLESTGVARSLDGTKLFVSQRTWLPTQTPHVTMIDLRDPTVAACLHDRTSPCNPGAAEVPLALPFAGGEHIGVSPWDGSIWVVSAAGRVARAASPQTGFVEVPITTSARPLNPGGMTIGNDGNVAIAANGNCPMSAACVKVIVPGLSNMLVNRSETFANAARVANGPATVNGIPVFVTLPSANQVARIAAGPMSFFPSGVNPTAVAVTGNGTVVTAAATNGPGAGNVTIDGPTTAPVTAAAGFGPAAIALGPVQRGLLRANPDLLTWTWSSLGVTLATQTVTYRNVGFEATQITRVSVAGPDTPNFVITRNTCNGALLARSATCQVDVSFTPAFVVPGRLYFIYQTFVGALTVVSDATYAEPTTLRGAHQLEMIPRTIGR